jgi:DNA polymerase III delta subunit
MDYANSGYSDIKLISVLFNEYKLLLQIKNSYSKEQQNYKLAKMHNTTVYKVSSYVKNINKYSTRDIVKIMIALTSIKESILNGSRADTNVFEYLWCELNNMW